VDYVKFWVLEEEKLICDKCKTIITDGFAFVVDFNKDTGLSNELVCEQCFWQIVYECKNFC